MRVLRSSWSVVVLCNYGVATVSGIDKILGFVCRILSILQGSFAKETYNFIDPADQSHPIWENKTARRRELYRNLRGCYFPYGNDDSRAIGV